MIPESKPQSMKRNISCIHENKRTSSGHPWCLLCCLVNEYAQYTSPIICIAQKWRACPVAVLWSGGLFTAAAQYRLSHCFTFSARFTRFFFFFFIFLFGLKLLTINTESQWYIYTWKNRKISCLSQTFNQREEEKEGKFGRYVTGESLFWNPVAFEVGW